MTKRNDINVGDRVAISTGATGTVTKSLHGEIHVRWDLLPHIELVYTARQIKTMPITRTH